MNKQTSLIKEVQEKIQYYSAKLNAPKRLLPLINESNDLAYPYIEIDSSGLIYFVVRERGEEYERRATMDITELLYWIFSGVTFSMATQYELENRVENQDSRKLIFEKQIELLTIIDQKWAEKLTWYK